MIVNENFEKGILKLAIDGDLDASSAIKMDKVIQRAYDSQQYKISINCELLSYISSAGLGVFISYLEDFQKASGLFVFHDMNDRVYHVFELLGLHNLFNIVNNETEAIKLLSNES